MATSLPQELLSLIANHITGKEEKLTPYTLVNKSWQAAFERRIYSSLVVLSPSDVDYITVGPTEQHKKRGLSLSRLDGITSGPQDWRQARRTYIRHILYRVAVPHYLEECRRGDDDYTYDNIWHRENNLAFSHGMRALFDYLPRLADQAISLDIALQAETEYFDEEDTEPDTLPIEVGYGTDLAPYCATFLPDWRLAASKCVRALEFPEIILPANVPSEYRGYSENKTSPPAILRIASACVALQRIKVDGACDIPCEESDLRLDMRIATAAGLSELPKSIRSLELSWSSPGSYEIPEVRSLNESTEQDLLCIALHKASLQLQDLVIFDMAVCPVLFCPDGLPGSAESMTSRPLVPYPGMAMARPQRKC